MSSLYRHLMFLGTAVLWWGIVADTAHAELQIGSHHEADEIQQAVQDVLSDPEYRHLHDDEDSVDEPWFESDDLPQWLKDFLQWLFGSDREPIKTENVFSFAESLYYLALTALAVALIYLIYAIIKSSDQQSYVDPSEFSADAEAIVPTRPPGNMPTNEYERRALAAAQGGDFRSALRELVLGSMSWTERAGLVRYRRGLTNRDYVRAIWRMAERRESLLQIVAAFERVFYGRRLADEATFENCLVEFRQSFLTEANDALPSN